MPRQADDTLADVSIRLRSMRSQEATRYAVPDYLAEEWQRRLSRSREKAPSPTQGGGAKAFHVNEQMRAKICEWYYQVADHFDINREVVSVALSYLDRYLAATAVDSLLFQLAAMTALYLAAKVYEPRKLCLHSFLALSHGNLRSEHVVAMENAMLRSLDWRVHPPTPWAFCEDLLRLLPADDVTPEASENVAELARYLTELAACDYWFATKRSSAVALASMAYAMEVHGLEAKAKTEFFRQAARVGLQAHAKLSERLGALRSSEASSWAVPDYLAEDWQRKLRGAADRAAAADGGGGGLCSPASSDAPRSPDRVGAVGCAYDFAPPLASPGRGGRSGPAKAPYPPPAQLMQWREKICDWCYRVVDHYDIGREVVSAALSYLDRHLAATAVDRRAFQLAAATALYLAAKVSEPSKLRLSSVLALGRGSFSGEEVAIAEMTMLRSLGWRVHPPTPWAFCRDLLELVPTDLSPLARVTELARFLTELAVSDYVYVAKKNSSVALASVLNALELRECHGVDPERKRDFLRRVADLGFIDHEEVEACCRRLRDTYVAGGYASAVDEGLSAGGCKVSSSSRCEAEDAGASPPAFARVVSPSEASPSAVVPEPRKRKARLASARIRAKRSKKDLGRELDREASLGV
ncbi:hypothetical protein ACHAWF_011131 [Thalassiosira exigua]